MARTFKTINYQLSSRRCLDEGWTILPRPASPAVILGSDAFQVLPSVRDGASGGDSGGEDAFEQLAVVRLLDSIPLLRIIRIENVKLHCLWLFRCSSLQDSGQDVVQQYYPDGRLFFAFFRDGSGTV